MLLGKIEIRFAKGFGLQTGINVAFERQYRLTGILRGKVRMPVVKTGGVEIGQLIADALSAYGRYR